MGAVAVPDPIANGDFVVGGPFTIEVGPAGKPPTSVLVLPANPDKQNSYDIRATLWQTLTGAYVDRYGAGVPQFVLSGTTAWMAPLGSFNGAPCNGWQAARHLLYDIVQAFDLIRTSHSSPNGAEMVIHDASTGQSWQVEPMPPFTTQQTSQNPIIVYYSLTLIVVADLTYGPLPPNAQSQDPVAQAISGPPVGSPSVTATVAPTAVPASTPSPGTVPIRSPSAAPTKRTTVALPGGHGSSGGGSAAPPTAVGPGSLIIPGVGTAAVAIGTAVKGRPKSAPQPAPAPAQTPTPVQSPAEVELPVAATTAQRQAGIIHYVTQAGDTLGSLAKSFLGDARKAPAIVATSAAIGTVLAIGVSDLLSPGTLLAIAAF